MGREQITVDGDTSTNDCVVAMASGFAGNDTIHDPKSYDARTLQAALTALLQGLAKTIAWDGEGATVCIEVCAPRPSREKCQVWVAITSGYQVELMSFWKTQCCVWALGAACSAR